MSNLIRRLPETIVPNLPGIIVLSHGPLAQAMVETASLIVGEPKNIAVLSVEPNDDLELYQKELEEIHRALPPGTIFLADIYGGTPYNQLILYAGRTGTEISALTGMNLIMLIEAISARSEMAGHQLIEYIETIVSAGIVNVSKVIEKAGRKG